MSTLEENSWSRPNRIHRGYQAYRSWIRGKTRIGLAWVLAVALILSARQYPELPGILIAFLGAALRFWASGYLRKDTKVAVGGPYRFTRNPLYLGTYLMALGTTLAIENYWLAGAFTLVFFGIYHFIIMDEEEKLEKLFGHPYQLYCRTVSRIFPLLWPPSSEKLKAINPNFRYQKFSWELAIQNKAYEAFAAFAGLIGFVWIVAFLWQNFA